MPSQNALAGLKEASIHLTEAGVEAAVKAVASREVTIGKDGRRWWRDAGSRNGLHLVVSVAGGAVYYRKARRPGSEAKVKQRIGDALTMRVATARQKALQLAGGDETAAAPVKVRTDGITADNAFAGYLADSRAKSFTVGRSPPKESTLASYEILWRAHVRPKFGKRSLHHLAKGIPGLLERLAAKHVTANRLSQVLKNVYAWGTKREHWEGLNPLIDPATGKPIRRHQVKSRARYLKNDEAARLLEVLDAEPRVWRDYFTLALLVGARAGNLRHMAWDELDLQSNVWSIPVTKADPVEVPLVPQAVAILRARQADATVVSRYVFPRRGHPDKCISDVDNAWFRIRTAAGLPGVRIHDLRRTVGSWAIQAGMSLVAVGRLLGHRSLNATAVYARAEVALSRQAADAVAARLKESLAARPAADATNKKAKPTGGTAGGGRKGPSRPARKPRGKAGRGK